MAGPGSESFDLTPYAEELRRRGSAGGRLFLYVGLGFSGLGIAIAALTDDLAGFDLTSTVGVIVASTLAGFAPYLIGLFGTRGWRHPATLSVDVRGFAVIDSAGRTERTTWEDPLLVVTVQQRTGNPLTGEGRPFGEFLLAMPKLSIALVPRAGREALVASARAAGLAVVEDEYDAALDGPGRAPVPTMSWLIGRAPSTGRGTVEAALASGAPGKPADAAQPGERLFPQPPKVPPYPEPGRHASEANPLRAVGVTSSGLRLLRARGGDHRMSWDEPRARVVLSRRLNGPLERLDAPGAIWDLAVRGTEQGFVTSETWAAIADAGRSAGLYVSSERLPGPFQQTPIWLAATELRRPPRST